MPPTHPSQADVAAYRTLIAHETEPKEQDFYRTRLQRLEQATEPVCEFDCRSRVAAAGVGVYCPQCSAKSADTDLATQLAKAIRAAWVDRLDWDELAHAALKFLTAAGRLVPAGGMALTAERIAELIADAPAANYEESDYNAGYVAALINLRDVLFPATEPAVERCQSVSIFRERCALVPGHGGRHAANGCAWGYPPTPAEPAEEETKAEARWELIREYLFDFAAEIRSAGNTRSLDSITKKFASAISVGLTSSPVVPAPTEPVYVNVPTWQEVPEGITYHPEGRPEGFVNRGGQPYYLGMSKPLSATFEQLEDFMRPQGPFYFVPAPTETGPWQHRDGRICVYAPAVTPRLRYRIGKFNDHGDFVYDDSERLLPEGFAPFVAVEEGRA
ncbi:hypothetical protein [Rhodococcus sp. (in: high G+C Gram-positive bacteria)]|uniref:hypothetical protein n=1 Tax=Rhodococcus sp. TaxID=1831 RepID=UPI001A18CDF5|nr:hypothetical protein [Rhodococcus sp. (in: high G+C Gram-positive bacteria)]MBJ7479239.1 hypothetical protein [Rhodococcus sp. (in: high G+C Gram-positive bacteria)]